MRPALRICLAALAALWISLGTAWAQPDATAVDYATWETTAAEAEEALGAARPDEDVLEGLRSRIAGFRDRFIALQEEQSSRISTIQAQLEALGPAPEEVEAEDVARRRSELTTQLAEARAPVQTAEEAFTRADGLIREIDQSIRARQTRELLRREAAPLNPVIWTEAAAALALTLESLWNEIDDAWIENAGTQAFYDTLPSVIVTLAAGLILLLRGRAWAEAAVRWLRRATRRGSGVWRFLLSLGLIVLPLTGILLIVVAARLTGFVTERVDALLLNLPIWLGTFVFVRWLALQTFSDDDREATLPIAPQRRFEARAYFNILSILMVLRDARMTLSGFGDWSAEINGVLALPVLIGASLVLFRLGQIFSNAEAVYENEEAEANYGTQFEMRVLRIVGTLLMIIASVAPLLAVAGYAALSQFMIAPTIASLLLAGLVLVLQRLVSDIYELVTGRTTEESQTLIPVLAGFILLLAAAPVAALIWGARTSDITELWTRFVTGFSIGETRISPLDFLTFALVFAIGYALTRLFQGGLRTTVLPKTRIDVGGQNAIVSGLGYVGVIIAALVAFTATGLDLSTLTVVAGALSIGIGFGLQTIVQNFVSGIILLIERPISQGDWIDVNGNSGFVKDISVRSTRIETFDRFDVIVPNADFITGTVTNYTHGNTVGRLIVPVSVSYGTDTRQVERILTSIARAHPLVLMNPEPFIYFKGFGDNALNFEIRVMLSDVLEILVVHTEMNHQIAERFSEEGIEIPFPQRDIWLRNAETLTGQTVTPHRAFAGKDQGTQEMPPEPPRHEKTSMGDPDGE
ncbi:DUF3772 domain-containing protein [Litorisediminicola beolgyonensis]|uniref:DUF3772 domain-containing protein n=1 Tax=Litorisediminicola beolgyonensis TaxID=1173614 RepID=A0ABW3ZF98_9RHOB